MKYVKRYIILISIVLLSFASCIKEVEFTGEETAPLPVLNCVVGDGDTVVYADLTRSLFFLRRGDFAPITDAEVVLTCNGTAYPMTLVGDSVYMLRHTFATGDLVSISATMPEFGTITSETMTVPAKPRILKLFYNRNEGEEDAKSFTLRFINSNPDNTYYQITVCRKITSTDYNEENMYLDWENEYISCNDSRILFSNTDFPSINEGQFLLFPAKNFHGDTVELKIELEDPHHTGDKQQRLELVSVSESLYKYLSTASNYYNSRENPFTEPVQVYTNVQGGLGVFGTKSYRQRVIYYDTFYQRPDKIIMPR